jgi:hypothetical protein
MKKSVTIAVLLGVSVIINLMFLMYAFTMKANAEKLQHQLEICNDEASHHQQILSDIKKELEARKSMRVVEEEAR